MRSRISSSGSSLAYLGNARLRDSPGQSRGRRSTFREWFLETSVLRPGGGAGYQDDHPQKARNYDLAYNSFLGGRYRLVLVAFGP